MKSNFNLIGLSKPDRFTLSLLNNKEDIFWSKSNFTKERFDALFIYCDNNWNDKKIAEVIHDGFNINGIPINPIVVNITEL
jgi:hypothetical protein